RLDAPPPRRGEKGILQAGLGNDGCGSFGGAAGDAGVDRPLLPARPHPNPSPEGEGLSIACRSILFPLSFRRGDRGWGRAATDGQAFFFNLSTSARKAPCVSSLNQRSTSKGSSASVSSNRPTRSARAASRVIARARGG